MIEPKVFMGLTQMEIDAVQPGPCVMCGATNYALSMGGSSICPACDCGASQDPVRYRKLRERCAELERQLAMHIWPQPQAEAIALLRELNDALAIPGWLQPRVDAVLDRADAGPNFNQERNAHADTIAAEHDSKREDKAHLSRSKSEQPAPSA